MCWVLVIGFTVLVEYCLNVLGPCSRFYVLGL